MKITDKAEFVIFTKNLSVLTNETRQYGFMKIEYEATSYHTCSLTCLPLRSEQDAFLMLLKINQCLI